MDLSRLRVFAGAILLCLAPTLVCGQSNRGRISGVVTDPSGASVPGAKITVENVGTHAERTLTSNGEGSYAATDIEPGIYSVKVEAPNFVTVNRERIQVEVGNDLKLDFQLKPGSPTEVVEVTEAAPLTETSNAVLNGVLANKAINELPVQGRDFQNLLALHPGVQRTPGGGFHSTTSNGNRPDDNNYIIDGANDNDSYYGETVVGEAGISGTPASLLPLDAIQEFNTQEQPQADFGAKPGVVMNIGLKSGTNDVHGTAYYFNRNSAYDARNYFNPSPSPFSALSLHEFGASVGGPFIKEKWFYFFDYEGIRDKVGNPYAARSPVTTSLATPANPTGDVKNSLVDAENDLGCSTVPSPCSPLSLSLAQLFLPNPGGTVDPNSPQLIDFDFNNVNRGDNIVFKSDYHLNSQNTFTGRFIYSNTNQTEEDAVPLRAEWLSQAIVHTQVLGLDWTYSPSSRWVNQARMSYNRFWEQIQPLDHNVNPAQYKTPTGISAPIDTGITDPTLFGFPRVLPGSNFEYLGGNSSWPLFTTPSGAINLGDTATFTAGKHIIRFGGSYQLGNVDYLRGNDARGRIDFRSLEDFLSGNVRRGELLVGDLKRNVRQTALAAFVDDTYRIRPRVTLNFGLRYDLALPIKESNNQIANFVPNVGIVQVGDGISSPYPTRWSNVSPRVGVAWDIFGTGKTVLRAGGGIIFEQPSIRTFVNSSGLNLNPSGVAGITPGTGSMNTFLRFLSGSDINFSGVGPVFNPADSNFCDANPDDDAACSVFGVDQHLKTPYVETWNMNVQQALTSSMMLQVAYVGNKGVKLYSNLDINQPNPSLSAQGILAVDGLGPIDAFSNVDYVPWEQRARPFFSNCPVSAGGLGTGGQCFPSLQSVVILGNQSSSIYHALQITLTKRYGHGLYLLAGYTYGHAIDLATNNLASVPQNSANYAADRGNGDFDIRHRFTLSATYEIPGRKAPLQMLEGWQMSTVLTLEGGEPFSLGDATNDVSATGEFSDRWNVTGPIKGIHWSQTGEPSSCNTSVQLCFIDPTTFTLDPTGLHVVGGGDPRCITAAGNQDAIDQLGNVGCYIEGNTILTPPALGTFGNLGRNTFRGPMLKNLDFSVSKQWRLNERFKLQFRSEFFNIFNHPNFDVFTMNTDMGDGNTLGQVVATPDVGNANPVIGSGGSRHIQFGLKLIW
jgi:hypothetical protein